MTIIDELIYDRTQKDINYLKNIRDKIITSGLNSLTDEEKNNYLKGLKGAYNASDMNRVGNAILYLQNRLKGTNILTILEESGLENSDLIYPIVNLNLNPNTNFQVAQILTHNDTRKYIEDISTILQYHDDYSNLKLPVNMDYFKLESANLIEKSLSALSQQLDNKEFNATDIIMNSKTIIPHLSLKLGCKSIGNRG